MGQKFIDSIQFVVLNKVRTWKYAETVGKKNIAEVSDPSFSCREQTAWRPAVRLYLYGSYLLYIFLYLNESWALHSARNTEPFSPVFLKTG